MRIKLVSFLIVFSVIVVGCARSDAASEKDIYQALFDYFSANVADELKVVVSEQSVKTEDVFLLSPVPAALIDRTPAEDRQGHLRNLFPATSPRLLAKFLDSLETSENIHKSNFSFTKKIRPIFVSESEINSTFSFDKGGDSWARFRSKFNGVRSLMRLSRPAIDLDSGTALVYVGVYCGATCGQGNVFLLVKTNRGWTVVHEEQMWVS